MSAVVWVPETRDHHSNHHADDHVDDSSRDVLRAGGVRAFAAEAFARFRFGDGFSSARALALQSCLSLIPFAIALVGLGSVVSGRLGSAITATLLRLTPGSSDALVSQVLDRGQQESRSAGGVLALCLGLGAAAVAMTSAMTQVERGANRIYGIQRDRPALAKYLRAARNAATAGPCLLLGFALIVGAAAFADSLADAYRWPDGVRVAADMLRFPVGALVVLAAYTVLLRSAARRLQPTWPWLASGAGVALGLWLLFTLGLVLYVTNSGPAGTTYGPLLGIVALLLWANLTSVALYAGIAVAAQLEAWRAGLRTAVPPDQDTSTDDGVDVTDLRDRLPVSPGRQPRS